MSLPVKQVEEFFEARFEPMSPGPGRELHHYDGFAYWSVLWDGEDYFFISADKEIGGSVFPVVEVAAYCSRVSTSHAVGVGPVLVLHPNDTEESSRFLVLTKMKAGRVSLCVSVGAGPDRWKSQAVR